MSEEFEMKRYFPAIDEAKLQRMYNIRKAYEAGTLPLDEARQQMKEQVGSVTPEEFAYAEQRFNPPGDADECRAESLKNIFDVFGDTLKIEIPHLHEAHPVNTYYREDRAIRDVIARMKEMQTKTFIKNPWRELMDQLAQIQIHYTRKQNQLYSYLERKGFKHPSTTMWNYDDHNRDLIKAARALLEADRYEEFLAALPRIYEDVLDLISKEETILLPVSLRMISEEEFRQMRAGDDEIGYCLIDPPVGFRTKEEEATAQPASSTATPAPEGFAAELQALLNKYQPASADPNAILDVAQGKLSLDQINLIYRHMPVDLAYVDEHDRVRFYTDTKHRVFPRSAGVIGREVKHCHPPKSVHVVEEIIEKFRSGEKDFVEFWINKPGVFIYITYTAVRDKDGTYRGVLEMMQDCTHIRSLEGSRTLLHWEDDEMGKPGTNDSRKKVKAKVPHNTAPEATSAPTAEAPETANTAHVELPGALAEEVKACTCGVAELELTADTKIATLVAMQPLLRDRLKEIHPDFSAVSNPILWNIMKYKATIGKMSERSGMPVEDIIAKLRTLIAEIGS